MDGQRYRHDDFTYAQHAHVSCRTAVEAIDRIVERASGVERLPEEPIEILTGAPFHGIEKIARGGMLELPAIEVTAQGLVHLLAAHQFFRAAQDEQGPRVT